MRLTRFTVGVVLGALVFVGCGGDDDGGGDGATTGGTDDGGTIIDGPLDAAQCAQVVGAMAAAAQAVPAAMSGGGGDLEGSVAQLEAFANEAPEEIRADLLVVAQAYALFMQVYADAGYDPASGVPPDAETIAALEEANATLDSAEFQEASDRVSAWFTSNCGG